MEEDIFTFRIGEKDTVKYTKRGLLSKLAGIFDPLGLVPPITIKAKIKMQQITIPNPTWDDQIEDHERKWGDVGDMAR